MSTVGQLGSSSLSYYQLVIEPFRAQRWTDGVAALKRKRRGRRPEAHSLINRKVVEQTENNGCGKGITSPSKIDNLAFDRRDVSALLRR
jgi:hypothetical protein